jgi:hypothetical protein
VKDGFVHVDDILQANKTRTFQVICNIKFQVKVGDNRTKLQDDWATASLYMCLPAIESDTKTHTNNRLPVISIILLNVY